MRTIQQIANDTDIRSIIWRDMDKPDRMRAMFYLKSEMSEPGFWKLFGDVWTNSESLFDNLTTIRYIFDDKSKCRPLMMMMSERKRLAEFDEWTTVYRGGSYLNQNGWSWTLDLDTAKGFGKRAASTRSSFVTTGYIHRANVIAYFDGRNEAEVVIDPNNVKLGSEIPIKDSELNPGRHLHWLAQTGNLNMGKFIIPAGQEDNFKRTIDERVKRLNKFGLHWIADDTMKRFENARVLPSADEWSI